jgi:hypothetical protein
MDDKHKAAALAAIKRMNAVCAATDRPYRYRLFTASESNPLPPPVNVMARPRYIADKHRAAFNAARADALAAIERINTAFADAGDPRQAHLLTVAATRRDRELAAGFDDDPIGDDDMPEIRPRERGAETNRYGEQDDVRYHGRSTDDDGDGGEL